MTGLGHLTNDELCRQLRDDNTLDPKARELLDRLTSALDEIDALTEALGTESS